MRSTALLAALVLAACPAPGLDDDEASGSSESGGESGAADASSTVDGESGETGETGEDMLPPAPTLASPSDGAMAMPIETTLCWNLVEDPEGEPLRYRLFVDELEITQGILGEAQGHEGPCVGPLLFAHEREFAWSVEAFEVDDPTRSSPRSETWHFTTEPDGISSLVFEDDFEADLGWTIGGDAGSGAWLRGDPVATTFAGASAQPSACAGGSACMYTGANPDGLVDTFDVSGGTTELLSPAFDLEGAALASVRLQRFFYASQPGDEVELSVELLVPDAADPDTLVAHPLEALAAPANLWTPREYVACGVPMRAGSRLRIRARDVGTGIVEAAIDSVSVHAHDDASACEVGEGGRCEPELGDAACPDALRCCAQGVVQQGVYRCEAPVAGLDFDEPTASPEAPNNGPLDCDAPDLIVDTTQLQPLYADVFMSQDTCEVLEGCVGGLGWRRLVLFTIATPNIGSTDLALGIPANLPELFHYSACHDHFHFDEFARYELLDGDQLVATGHKQAFCLLDTLSWAWPFALPQFDCSNQGISRGFSDYYESGLPCQWVDITGLPAGDYTLRITLNQPRPGHALPLLIERRYDNDSVEVALPLR